MQITLNTVAIMAIASISIIGIVSIRAIVKIHGKF